MDASLERKVIDSLDALERGEAIEQILARYPEATADLRPILETAVLLSQTHLQPSIEAKNRSRQAFLAQAAGMKTAPAPHPPLLWRLRQLLLPVASLLLLLLSLGAGLVAVSSSAIPGDALYRVKRQAEAVRLSLTADPATQEDLLEQFNQERIREIRALLRANREAVVAFQGTIETVQTDTWTVAGLSLVITSDTQITGVPAPGRLALVQGRAQNGRLLAMTVTIPGSEEPVPTPTAAPSPTLQPTATITPSATTTPEPTETGTAEAITPSATITSEPTETATVTTTPTATSTATFIPTATQTPTQFPTATPTLAPPPPVNDNDNQNDNDNENENGNENENENENDNENENGNENENENENDNENENENENEDDNENENDNSSNANDDSDDS